MKKRNGFDGKDMILLVVTLCVIYLVCTWLFAGDTTDPNSKTSDEYLKQLQQQEMQDNK